MVQAHTCKRCSEAHDCQRIYRKLGQAEGPSVAGAVLVAFALPLLVFIACLAGFGILLRGRLGEPYQTPVVFLLALVVTAGSVLVASACVKRLQRVATSGTRRNDY